MKKWIISILVIVVVASVTYYWKVAPTAEQPVEVATSEMMQTITVKSGSITAGISPTGEVYAPEYSSLFFNVTLIPIEDIYVEAGQTVEAGEVLATLDTESLERAVDQAEADLLSAQEDLDEVLEQYSDLDLQKAQLAVSQAEVSVAQAIEAKEELLDPDLESAEKAIVTAEYNLEMALLSLEQTKLNTKLTTTIRDLEYTVAWHERNVRDLESQAASGESSTSQASGEVLAQISRQSGESVEPMTLEEALEALAEVQNDLELAQLNASLTLANAQDKVTQSQDALEEAQEELTELQAGPTALELAKADNNITQTEYRLAKAQDDLANAEAEADPKDVQLAQAKYDAAAADLTEAEKAVNESVLVAPFSGTIISVKAEVGEEVSSSDVILTLANLDELEITAFIDETEITQVEVGQEVKITFDAFAGYEFTGQVLEVPIQGALSSNVVYYEVPISLEGWEEVNLKTGMTANLSIATAERENTLLLPVYAVQWSTDGNVVMVQDSPDQEPTLVPVQTGVTDGTYVEILRGLNEGDTVVVEYDVEEEEEMMMPGMGGMAPPDAGQAPGAGAGQQRQRQ